MGDYMENSEHDGMEKRKHMRIPYPAEMQPTFRARGQILKIKDVSRGGLKFYRRDKIILRGWIKGTMDLNDGTCIEVEGIVVRIANKDMGLSFISDLDDDVYRQIINKVIN
jgi:hypothetical protein